MSTFAAFWSAALSADPDRSETVRGREYSQFIRDLARVVSRSVAEETVATKYEIGVTEVREMIADVTNAAMFRRMLPAHGDVVARSPSPGVEVLVTLSERFEGAHPGIDIWLSVTNTLADELPFVGVTIVSFTNSSLDPLAVDGPLERASDSPSTLVPGESYEYHTTYTLRAEDFDDEGELICSFLVEGRTEAGEWVIAHEDDSIRLSGAAENVVRGT